MSDKKSIDRRQAIGLMGMTGFLTVCSKAPLAIDGTPDSVNSNDTKNSGNAETTSPSPSLPDDAGNNGSMPSGNAPSDPPVVQTPVPDSKLPDPVITPVKRSCVLSPAQIEGPYFVDEKLNRSDIRADPSDGSLQKGIPLSLQFYVGRISGALCEPLSNVTFDIWHANPLGIYSDVTNAKGKKYLRGYQVTDSNGQVTFKTVYPGWYPGRAVHVHIKIRIYNAAQKLTFEFTTQIYFADAISKAVYASDPAYKGRETPDTTNATDGFYNNSKQLLVALEKDGVGYKGVLDVGVKLP